MKYILYLIIFSLITISCGPSKQNDFENSPERLKEKLLQNEYLNYREYLKVDWNVQNPLFGRNFINGTITNKASVATYKDMVIEVQYISKTNTVIKSWKTTIYEFLRPNHSLPFKIDMFKYGDEVKAFKVLLVDANTE